MDLVCTAIARGEMVAGIAGVIFHLPGSVGTMWPPGKTPVLRNLLPVSPG